MPKKPKPKNKKPSKRYEKYSIKDGKIERKPTCPKCGAAIFLAHHKNRVYCGKCGYTEFKRKTESK